MREIQITSISIVLAHNGKISFGIANFETIHWNISSSTNYEILGGVV